jgi:hypothetical protein
MMPKTKRNYVTNVYPHTKLVIDGSSIIEIRSINSFGQVELAIEVDLSTHIETFKVRKDNGREKTKD